jgi:hypothetical protein
MYKPHAIPFNIFTNARYHHVKVASEEVTLQSSTIGFNKTNKKLDVLSIENECIMLAQATLC